jgi:hypothetical protein
MPGKLGDIKKKISDEHIILTEGSPQAKRGVKSLMDASKSYKKIHPDASEETRKKIKKLCAELDLPLWVIVEQAINDLAEKHKID